MRGIDSSDLKEVIMDKTFKFLVETGLENITMRELCKKIGFNSSSIYYWFENKEGLICESAVYGAKKLSDIIFSYCFDNTDNLEVFFKTCVSKLDTYRSALRLIYQIATSPVYEERFKKVDNHLLHITNAYAERMSKALNSEVELLSPLVYLFMSAIIDYAIWGNKIKTQMQFDYIYSQCMLLKGTK